MKIFRDHFNIALRLEFLPHLDSWKMNLTHRFELIFISLNYQTVFIRLFLSGLFITALHKLAKVIIYLFLGFLSQLP